MGSSSTILKTAAVLFLAVLLTKPFNIGKT